MRSVRVRRIVVLAAATMLLVTLGAAPGAGIPHGERDADDEYPHVGMVVFHTLLPAPGVDDPDPEEPADWVDTPIATCSGTLLTADIVLTAGHCTDIVRLLADDVPFPIDTSVSFRNEHDETDVFDLLAEAIPGEPETHPEYDDFASFPNTRDLGVVWLDEPVDVSEVDLPDLPEPGHVDELATGRQRTTDLTVVGYGLQGSQVIGANPDLDPPALEFDDDWDFDRWVGTVSLVTTRSAYTDGFNLHHSGNPGRWSGGTCFGDSGGPVLDGDTIVAVVSFGIGNPMCRGNTGLAYRLDIPDALDWLHGDVLVD